MKALLISMPWADYQLPSLQVGCLSAYARQNGFDVEGNNLHLKAAANYGLSEYNKILECSLSSDRARVGECFFIMLLFPEMKKKVMSYLHRRIDKPEWHIKHLSKIIKRIYNDINWSKYSLVGFSACHDQLFASLLFAKWIKRDHPRINIVLGGPLVEGKIGESILNCFPYVDWCIDGEGELAFIKLLRCISNKSDRGFDKVPSLIHRTNKGIKINPRIQLRTLQGLPDPDYDDYFTYLENKKFYKNEGLIPLVPIEGSRGCFHRCAFCSVHSYWTGFRVRPPNEVVSQLKRLSDRYRVNSFSFVDNNFTNNNISKLFPLIENQGGEYRLFVEIRADIHKLNLQTLRQAGVNSVQVGIEALSSSLLKKMNKGTRMIDNIQVMKYCEELGLINDSNLILGFPTETQKDIDESSRNIDYVSAYRPPIQVVKFRLDHDALIFKYPDKYGVYNIRNARIFNKLLPDRLSSNIILTVKDYNSRGNKCDYRMLRKKVNIWEEEYYKAVVDNRKLLCYYDMGDYLLIEDSRHTFDIKKERISSARTIKLENIARELYVYCDAIKHLNEIMLEFKKINKYKVKKVLNQLVKLKLIYREDDSYLSLAIRANTCTPAICV